MAKAPTSAFSKAIEIFEMLLEPDLLVVLNCILEVLPKEWERKDIKAGLSDYKVRTVISKMVRLGLVTKFTTGRQTIYSFNYAKYEQYCGAAARVL